MGVSDLALRVDHRSPRVFHALSLVSGGLIPRAYASQAERGRLRAVRVRAISSIGQSVRFTRGRLRVRVPHRPLIALSRRFSAARFIPRRLRSCEATPRDACFAGTARGHRVLAAHGVEESVDTTRCKSSHYGDLTQC